MDKFAWSKVERLFCYKCDSHFQFSLSHISRYFLIMLEEGVYSKTSALIENYVLIAWAAEQCGIILLL